MHSLHVISFHISGPFEASKANDRWSYYSLTGAPSNVYDGQYRQTYYIDESDINTTGARQVHKLQMSLTKAIEGSTLTFQGSVSNLETHAFHGFVLVYITESHRIDPDYGVEWNFVFRAYGTNKSLSLEGSSTDTFSGTWNVPGDAKTGNIQVVAAAFDADDRDTSNGWTHAVQSVCDVCGLATAVPEFPTFWVCLIMTPVLAATVLWARRRTSRARLRSSFFFSPH
jgi:hypothetical protein